MDCDARQYLSKKIGVLGLLLVMSTGIGCSSSKPRIELAAPMGEAVVSTTVELSVAEVRWRLLAGFSSERWSKWTREQFFLQHGFVSADLDGGTRSVLPIYLESEKESTFGWQFFRDRENREKLFGYMHDAYLSRDYTSRGEALACTSHFSVTLIEAEGARTLIQVDMIEPKAYVGKEFNAHVLGFVPRGVSVPVGVNDRYTFLRLIRYVLGEEGRVP